MNVLGLIPEPPFDPKSWSGSSARFFNAGVRNELFGQAHAVQLSKAVEYAKRLSSFTLPVERWRENYHASVSRFRALTAVAGRVIDENPAAGAVLQIGAWFSAGTTTARPCFSYHDGNAALWYRYYDRRLISKKRIQQHLAWERSVYEAMTGIFVMSSWLAASFSDDFGIPRKNIHVIGAGINFETMPALTKRNFAIPRFLFIGRDFERKGGRYLLEAFRQVRREVPHAELTIVGPTLNLVEPNITVAGFLSKSDPSQAARLHELLCAATAVVLPSIYEPFGISLTEGMAYGLPCIATDRCAMPEIVQDQQSGFVVPAADAGALAEAMLKLALYPVGAENMGAAGRSRIERDFTWNSVTQKMREIMRNNYGIV